MQRFGHYPKLFHTRCGKLPGHVKLNDHQREAVNTLRGPLLVLAGAGTGKTSVVTTRIARLIATGTRPDRILAVTFTNKAAGEMQQRVAALLGHGRTRKGTPKRKPEISTFHSLCVRVLQRHIERLGYPKRFAIYGRGDQESIARQVLREIRAPSAALRPGELLYHISRWKSAAVRPPEAGAIAQSDKEHLAASAYRRYQNALKAAGAVDFDDLLLLTEELLRRFDDVRQAEAKRFDHILIDEYQDTNGSQYRIVRALAEGHRNLCVVGDDDQSIYGWRGAEVQHILRFKHDWPDAKVVRLEDNYRSTRQILEWANRLIAFNRLRHDKRLRAALDGDEPKVMAFNTGEEEALHVVARIKARIDHHGRRPKDFAILCRTNKQPRLFEQELRRRGIPYILLGGMSFFDRREVRDVMAYLKLLANPRDEVALLRVINTPPRGLGDTLVRKLLETAVAQGKPLWDLLPKATEIARVTSTGQNGIRELTDLVEHARHAIRSRPLEHVVRELIERIGYREELARLYPDGTEWESRWASVEEVVNALAQHNRRDDSSLDAFLRSYQLDEMDSDRDKESKLDRDAVALMTLHSAKGLEFPEVFLVGMERGLLPHHRSLDDPQGIDEERRLCYVGVTRAKQRLVCTRAETRMKWGKPRPTIPSQFLYELTGKADNPNYLVASGKAQPGKQPKGKRACGRDDESG